MQGTTANKLLFLDLDKSKNYTAYKLSWNVVDLQVKIDEVCILAF
jgi:hypothetical protein